MDSGRGLPTRGALTALLLALAMASAACGSGTTVLKQPYEYEEELYLALDGTATLNVNASVASLVALRGLDLPIDPRARLDREQVRALFEGPGAEAIVSLSRRDGRRFVHVSVEASDVKALERLAPFSWSSYRFDRQGEQFEYRQVVRAAAGREVGEVGWDGSEIIGFRIHVPSEIDFHNAPSRRTERGNILVWEQALSERRQGTPIELHVQMQSRSILSDTLMLFGSAMLAALVTLALVIWWVARRGRGPEVAESRS